MVHIATNTVAQIVGKPKNGNVTGAGLFLNLQTKIKNIVAKIV